MSAKQEIGLDLDSGIKGDLLLKWSSPKKRFFTAFILEISVSKTETTGQDAMVIIVD